jgi:tRNA uridine 5-carboxymethylaminomethyl modification enzyme
MSLQNIAQMSCNPAMGNCQGSNCREIDAFDTQELFLTEQLFSSRCLINPKDQRWSPRVQSDRMRFAEEWRMMLSTPNLDFIKKWLVV